MNTKLFRSRRALAAALVISGVLARTAPAQRLFDNVRVDYRTASAVSETVIADLNNDGVSDVAATIPASSLVLVYLGLPDGSLLPPLQTTVVNSPNPIAAGDLDGDSDTDLVVGLTGTSGVRVLLNDGFGVMTAGTVLATSNPSYDVVLMQVDGSDGLDIVSTGAAALDVFYGDNAGDFSANAPVSASSTPFRLHEANLNADGRPDLFGRALGAAPFLRAINNGTSFNSPSIIPSATQTGELPVDLDGDGDDDMVLAQGGSGQLRIIRNDVVSVTDLAALTGITQPGPLAAGDVDLDGDLDLLVVSNIGSHSGIYHNLGTGAFNTTPFVLRHGLPPTHVSAGMLGNDAAPDFVIAGANGLSTFMGDAAGGVHLAESLAIGPPFVDIDAADADGDGDVDLFCGTQSGAAVVLRRNTGSGAFSASESIAGSIGIQRFTLLDTDRDGDTDLASLANTGSLQIFENDGSGTYSLASSHAMPIPGITGEVEALEVDGVNGEDLVVSLTTLNQLRVLLNDGNGGFVLQPSLAQGGQPTALAQGDIDNDGDTDLAVALQAADLVAVYTNNGGTFSVATVATLDQPHGIELADLDGDGRPELIVPHNGDTHTRVYHNSGPGGFTLAAGVPTGSGNKHARTVDLDGDGDLDLAVAVADENTISVIGNFGSLIFAALPGYEAANFPKRLAVGDIDGNGSPDLAAANSGNGIATLLFNSTPTVTGVEVTGPREITVTFSEPVENQDLFPGSYTLAGSARGSLSATPDSVAAGTPLQRILTWNTGEMLQGGDATVAVSAFLRDNRQNSLGFRTALTDVGGGIGTAPAGAFSTAFGDATNSLAFSVDLILSETPAPGFGAGSVVVSNGSIQGSLSAGGSFTFDILAAGEGPVTLTVPAGGATDPAGNATAEDITITVVVDLTAPEPALGTFDATRVGPAPVTVDYNPGEGGAGIAAATLLVREAGAGAFTPFAALPGTAAAVAFAPASDGVYELAVSATDLAGNASAAPTTLLTVVYNADAGPFTHEISAPGSYPFPMTNELDVTATVAGSPDPGATMTVNRRFSTAAPAGMTPSRLIDEYLEISGDISGAQATFLWAYDPASADGLNGVIDTVFQIEAGIVVDEHPATVGGSAITFGPVATFSEWWAGNASTSVQDWDLMD
ncbi:MAG: VCBS repeat-containing protein [Candidatus Sumerlaeia bacterium]|nr:VCBS repeat-containing protein [Candidatus Sumerlaeia bacterium]